MKTVAEFTETIAEMKLLLLWTLAACLGMVDAQTDCVETLGTCGADCEDKMQIIVTAASGGGTACTSDLACAAGDGACPAPSG